MNNQPILNTLSSFEKEGIQKIETYSEEVLEVLNKMYDILETFNYFSE